MAAGVRRITGRWIERVTVDDAGCVTLHLDGGVRATVVANAPLAADGREDDFILVVEVAA